MEHARQLRDEVGKTRKQLDAARDKSWALRNKLDKLQDELYKAYNKLYPPPHVWGSCTGSGACDYEVTGDHDYEDESGFKLPPYQWVVECDEHDDMFAHLGADRSVTARFKEYKGQTVAITHLRGQTIITDKTVGATLYIKWAKDVASR